MLLFELQFIKGTKFLKMPHISKQQIDPKILDALFLNLSKSLSKIKGEKNASLFLKEILTKTERIMIGKRLAIIWLLYKGVNHSKIVENLKISWSTLQRVSLGYEKEKYNNTIKLLMTRERDLFNELYKILHLGRLLKPYGVKWGRE